ncbi:DUF1648 domain-containing protein [Nocardioides alcanivorans]|uniref:DUF1648 domain-containing protein n=1 Tax=Nocardioides alcanivorans TaxID=2897352 RepID=UPI001F2BE7AE|nr:DUF1648 domain-containing protein [Nocardioides alcanivorans]
MRNPGTLFLLATGVVHAVVLAMVAPGLPDRVPTHFGGSGKADDWSSRAEALWTFGLIGAGLLLLFVLISLWIPRMNASMINAPHKEWWTETPEREATLRRRIANDTSFLGGATILLISLTTVDTARAAQTSDPELGWLFWGGLIGYLLLTVGVVVWMYGWRYRPEQE